MFTVETLTVQFTKIHMFTFIIKQEFIQAVFKIIFQDLCNFQCFLWIDDFATIDWSVYYKVLTGEDYLITDPAIY